MDRYEDLCWPSVDVEEAQGWSTSHENFGGQYCLQTYRRKAISAAALEAADHVIKQRTFINVSPPLPWNPRECLPGISPAKRSDDLVIDPNSHLLRTQLALMIGIPENKLRVITPEVGGGFGSS